MASATHHFWNTGRVLVAIVLLLIVAVIVVLALEPLLRLGMFLGFVAPHLPAK